MLSRNPACQVSAARTCRVAGAWLLFALLGGSSLSAQIIPWNSGDILGVLALGNPPTVDAGETLDITTTAQHDFNQKVITNNGTISWLAGEIRSGGGGSIANNGTFVDTATNEMNNDYNGGWAFNNTAAGTYLKSSGSSVILAGVSFNNQGLVDVTGGTLTIQGGGNLAGGTLRAATGATINLASSFVANGTVTLEGPGDIRLTAGTFSGATTFTGPLNWVGGNFNGAGTTTFDADATLSVTSTGQHDFNQRALVNQGTVVWSAGELRSGGGGSFTNQADFHDATTANTEINNDYTGGVAFTNSATGTYTKSGATTTTFLGGVAFNNAGQVNINAGTLVLGGGGNLTGGTLTTSGTGQVLIASNFAVNGTTTFAGSGVTFSSGTISGTGTVLEGPLNWTSGDFNGTGTTTFGSTTVVTLAAGSLHDFNQRQLVNNGIFNWSFGEIRSGGGGSFTNNAQFNDAATSEFNNDYTGGWSFTNAATGSYLKSAGTTTFGPGVSFHNPGDVLVTGGTIVLGGGGNLTGGTLTTSGTGQVLIASNFAVNGTTTFAGAGVTFSDGTISGTGTVLEGPLSWTLGDFNGAGSTTFGTSAVISATGANQHDFNQRHLVNNGTFNWTGGELRSGGGGSFTNNESFNAIGGIELNNDYTGGWTFINPASGVFVKSGAGTTSFLSGVPLNNTGFVHVSGGTLALSGGGNLAGGTLSAAAGTLININSSFHNPGIVNLSGPGEIRFSAGTMSGLTTFEGPLNWTTGDFNGAGTTTFGASAEITASGAGVHDFNQRHLVNEGVFHWTGGELRSGGGGSFTNETTFNDVAGVELNNDYTGGWTFVNTAGGTYTKTGAGVTTFGSGVTLQNLGLIDATAGTLVLSGGGNLSGGTIQAGSGATVLLNSNFNNPGTVTFAGTGNIQFTTGTMSGATTFEGPLNWSAGNFNGGGTTTFGATAQVNVTTAGLHDFNQRALVNFGQFTWFDGPIRAGGGASFTNRGVFEVLSLSDAFNNDYTGGWSFVNELEGMFAKRMTGVTTVGTGVGFVNKGAMEIDLGTLQFNGGLTLQATSELLYKLNGTATDTGHGLVSVSTALALNGTLDLRFGSGLETTLIGSETFTVLSASSLSGSFANIANGGRLWSADGLGSFQVNYGAGSLFAANTVVLSNFVPVPEPSTWALLFLGIASIALTAWRRRA